MEKLEMQSSSNVAKLLGTIMEISGTMVFTFYQGPDIFMIRDSQNQLLSSQLSSRVFGGLILFLAITFGCIWIVLQSATAKEFPDHFTIVFFFCLFGTLQCIALSPFQEPNPSAWVVQPGIGMIAIAVYSVALRINALTWCSEKKGPVFVTMFSPLSLVIGFILGVTFLGDSLYLGNAIGEVIGVVGFYAVMWGQANEKNKLDKDMNKDLDTANQPRSSDLNDPLLQSFVDI
ncbi:WAT1-related protein At5g40240-like [Bidens hawaiensis]|uniref:WAT1-related protein At5g40240-like n=1 Tax=Bidens hawaiensis TaxID=980011 RepID=UPI004049F911